MPFPDDVLSQDDMLAPSKIQASTSLGLEALFSIFQRHADTMLPTAKRMQSAMLKPQIAFIS
jgi:hypothetical protein